jgi:hypothetical protein
MTYKIDPSKFLTQDELALVEKISKQCDTAAEHYHAECERILCEKLTELIGYMPESAEMKEHGTCAIGPDGSRVFSWMGTPFLQIAPMWNGFTPQSQIS